MRVSKIAALAAVIAMIAVIASFSIASAAGPPAIAAADWRQARTARVGTPLRLEVEPAGARGARRTLSVKRIDPFAPSAMIVAHGDGGDVDVPRPDTVWFAGTIEDDPEALVTVAVDAAGSPRGFVVERGAYWVVEAGAAGSARLARGPAMPSSIRSLCGTTAGDVPLGMSYGTPPPGARSARSVTTRTIDLALETDYELFAVLGSTPAVLEYVGDLVAATAAIYRRDVDATFRIVHLSLWTAGAALDPWTFTNKFEGFDQFRGYWLANRQGVARNLAHFLSGYALQDGGLGQFAALCHPNNGFGFAFTNIRLIDLPYVGPYNPILFAHELGHQLGSVHTHCYDPPIDACHAVEPGCYAGPVSQPPDGGTIMSYCPTLTSWLGRPGFYGDRSERASQTIDAYISASNGCLAAVTCGDGALDAGEDCDDGNGVNGDGCSAICGFETACGNGTQESNEQCDDGNTNASDGCTDRCTICGNGTTTAPFEECDDGNITDDDVCSASCRVPRCGDGYVTAPEECDDGNDIDDDGCTLGCTTCGNGAITDPETCDDGDLDAGDGCEPGCVPTAVGRNLTLVGTPIAKVPFPGGSGTLDLETMRDRVRPPAGSADPNLQFDSFNGNTPEDDWVGYALPGPHTFTELLFQEGIHFHDGGWFTALSVQVRKDSVWVPVSGLSVSPTYPGVNDGVSYETYRLSFDATSGEAIRLFGPEGGSAGFVSIGELWIYGTPSAGTCGNGVVEGVESCDAGPANGLGGCCTTTCQLRVDGTVCDDGNAGTCFDVCQAGTCVGETTAVCGDGVTACSEQCDDGNTVGGDGCSSTCTDEISGACGNGIINLGEQCDDGDLDDTDGCTSACTICGNGVITPPELCDDGNLTPGDYCSASCQPDCPLIPLSGCRYPPSGKSSLHLKKGTFSYKDQLTWKWGNGPATPKADFGQPDETDPYLFCIWPSSGPTFAAFVPPGGACPVEPCWIEKAKTFGYKSKIREPDGIEKIDLKEGLSAGKAKIGVKGKGHLLGLPNLTGLTAPFEVQLIRPGGPCWGAVFSAPLTKHDAAQLKDKSD